MADVKKKRCLRFDAFGHCIDYEMQFTPYDASKSQHKGHQQRRPVDPNIRPYTPIQPQPQPGGGGGIPSGPPIKPKPGKPEKRRKVLPTPSNMSGFKAKPTIKSMPEHELEKAKMARAARIFRDDGHDSAQEFLDENGVNHTIDPELSDNHGLVLKNNETGKVKVAYRGTDAFSPHDLITDAGIGVGVPTNQIKQMNQARNQMKDVISKYGKPEETVGFSLGGAKAIRMGEEFGVPSTTFNPFITAKEVFGGRPKQQHNIYRTTEDFATLGLTVANDGFNVNSIDPLKKSIDPMAAHELDNFINRSERRPAMHHALAEGTMNAAYDAGEHKMINDTHNAVQRGDSFEDHASSVHDADVFTDKPAQFDKMVKLWKESGGKITPEEQEIIDGAKESYRSDLPMSGRQILDLPDAKVNPLAQMPDDMPAIGSTSRPRARPERLTVKRPVRESTLTDYLDKIKQRSEMKAKGQSLLTDVLDERDAARTAKEARKARQTRPDYERAQEIGDRPGAMKTSNPLNQPRPTRNPLTDDSTPSIGSRPSRPSRQDMQDILDSPDATVNPLAQDQPEMRQHSDVPMKTTRQQRDDFRRKSPEERAKIVDGKLKDASDMSNITDAVTEPHSIMKRGLMKDIGDGLAENLHPTNLAGGLVAGIVGDKVANMIDPNGAKTHATAHNFLSGSIAGGVGHIGMTKLAGSSALTAGEIASSAASGGVGMAVGGLTQEGTKALLKRVGANKATQESVSDIAGGSSGFAAATATGKAIQAGSKAIQAARETAQATKASQAAGEGIEMTSTAAETAEGVGTAAETAGAAAETAGASLAGAGESIGGAIAAAEEFGGTELAAETGGLSILAAAGVGALVGGVSYTIGHAKEIGRGMEHGAEAVGHGIVSGAKAAGRFFRHLF